jgi:FkbM family methyltransferase
VIDWSGISRETLLGRALRHALRWIPSRAVLTVRQGVNSGCKWISGSSVHGCWLGSYELEKQSVVKTYTKPGMTAFDLGANAGFFTLMFSRLVGAAGNVWAFEPLAENVHMLRQHIQLNHLRNVTIVQAAISSASGLAPFEKAKSNAMGRVTTNANSNYRVPTLTLDQIIADGGSPMPDIVKVDVEGAEAAVLEGAEGLLRSGHAIWLIALDEDTTRDWCVDRLDRAGYRLSTLRGVPWAQAPDGDVELLAVPG